MHQEDFLRIALDKRREQNAFRQLRTSNQQVDFCSNDYLGLARSERIQEEALQICRQLPQVHGSGGSRLLAGNYELVEEAEKLIAGFHDAPAGLIFNSGYDANLGFFASVPQKGDVIIYDQLIHASIRDGIRLSPAQAYSFFHNDTDDLAKKLNNADGRVFVAVESVYSMDGDTAPLQEIAGLCHRHQALLVVDEAHATGIIGEKGKAWYRPSGCRTAVLPAFILSERQWAAMALSCWDRPSSGIISSISAVRSSIRLHCLRRPWRLSSRRMMFFRSS